MQEVKITEKQFCDIIADLLKNEDTKKLFENSFSRNEECQLKK